jgi:uncharacterized membrane protein YbaN (DUF454 family)
MHNKPIKWVYMMTGCLLVGLATLGVFLPLLPTTPLLLLAAACFVRSSEKCHRWLLEHRVFGPTIRDWQEKRCISRRAKIISLVSMILFGGYAVGFAVANIYLRVIGAIALLMGLITVLRLEVCDHSS